MHQKSYEKWDEKVIDHYSSSSNQSTTSCTSRLLFMIQSTTSITQSTAWPYCLKIAAYWIQPVDMFYPVGWNLSTCSIQSTGSTSSRLDGLLPAACSVRMSFCMILHPGCAVAAPWLHVAARNAWNWRNAWFSTLLQLWPIFLLSVWFLHDFHHS